MPIRLMENFRAIFYAPYYATVALGFYEREGVAVELMTSNAPGDAVPKLLSGEIDLTWGGPMRVMQAFEPFVSMAEKDGAGETLYAASTRGPTSYTAFIATREACTKHRDEFAAMTRATAKMLHWLYANPPEDMAKAVATFFPDVPLDILVSSLARYRAAGLWSRETKMIPQGFARLGQSFCSGGMLTRMPSYDECVEPYLNGI